MRQVGSPLDLNNLPEEYGKQAVESSTTTATSSSHAVRTGIKKKGDGGKDDAAKVYECRFCSLKFGKSQALGGHMNRHRQERETETLNRARQLVFGNESLAAIGAQAQMTMTFRDVNMAGAAPPTVLGGNFRGGASATGGSSVGDPCLPFRPVHPGLSSQPSYHYLYTAPSTLHPMSYPPATYPGPPRQPAVGDYVIGHAVSAGGGDALMQSTHRSSFSCFGAPLTAPPAAAAAGAAAAAMNVQADKLNCNCSFGCGGHSRNNNVNAST
ncbi:JAG [Zea mays]|uniref:C2H2-type domain-containing protein n=1 Tax=Zea mays TaxID=4577 RepID=A0A804N0I5_MAIZE|nr:JAG [Zea mays]|eukprot:XP_008672812.1 JAG isoform X1 [Zea mays]